jgi:hypothetical protein
MALILPVVASMLAWAILFFFLWAFTVRKLECVVPPLVDAHNKKVDAEAAAIASAPQSKGKKTPKLKKKTVGGDVFDVQNRIVSIFHALVCIAVTAHQIREEGIAVGAVNTQLQVAASTSTLARPHSPRRSSSCP